MNNKDTPAFPRIKQVFGSGEDYHEIPGCDGLSKRELIATNVLNGLIAQCAPGSWQPREMQHLAQQAAAFADALLTELSKAENDLP